MNDSSKQRMQFRDPPPRKGGPTNTSIFWEEVATKCRANPGQWLHVGEWSTAVGGSINSGTQKAFRGGGFEATTRRAANPGRADIYVRYVGDQS